MENYYFKDELLRVVNLSPPRLDINKLEEVHPMKQIFWAAVIQAAVFGFMLLSFWLINGAVQ